MPARTTDTTVSFKHPFILTSLDGLQPAGTYRVVVHEEEILGLSFLAFQRTATMFHTPAISVSGYTSQIILVDPRELAAALEADKQT